MSINPLIPTTIFVTATLMGTTLMKDGVTSRPDLANSDEQHFLLVYIDSLSRGYFGLVAALLCMLLCWIVNYFNWFNVGGFPSTPISPRTRSRMLTRSPINKATVGSDDFNIELSFFTPILVSLATAGIVMWNSS